MNVVAPRHKGLTDMSCENTTGPSLSLQFIGRTVREKKSENVQRTKPCYEP